MIKLICTDIDGTLVKDGGSELPKGFAGLVRELKKEEYFLRRQAADHIQALNIFLKTLQRI